GGRPFYEVRRFVEKPPLAKAKRYLASGDYMWNAGMFAWSVGAVWRGLERHASELYAAFEPVRRALQRGRRLAPVLKSVYPDLEKISVDFALLEKSENVVVVPAAFDWDDVGAWPAVAHHHPK